MAGGDSVDGTALRFLVKKALERQKEEEETAKDEKRRRVLEEAEEERKPELNRRVSADLPLTQAETDAWRWWILLPPRSRKREEEEEEADSSDLFPPLSWPRSTSTTAVSSSWLLRVLFG